VKQLKIRDDPELVWKIYAGMCSFVSQIAQKSDIFTDLIQSIFSFDWNMDLKIVVAFINLLCQLISADAVFLIQSLRIVVKGFLIKLPTESQGMPIGEVHRIFREKRMRLHQCLRNMITMVPTGQAELLPILAANFPYKRSGQEATVSYVTQVLHVCEYLPLLQPKLLELVIEKCLEIDVEIVIEDTGEVWKLFLK